MLLIVAIILLVLFAGLGFAAHVLWWGLILAVASIPPGNTASLSVRRGGRDMDVSVTVGRRPANDQG